MDLYKALGVKKSATAQDIKSAWRKAQVSWHPDKHPGDKRVEERFKRMSSAYGVLSDPKKRREYDLEQASDLNIEGLNFNISQEDIVSTLASTINEYLENKIPNYRETVKSTYARHEASRNRKSKRRNKNKKTRLVKQGNVVLTIPKS